MIFPYCKFHHFVFGPSFLYQGAICHNYTLNLYKYKFVYAYAPFKIYLTAFSALLDADIMNLTSFLSTSNQF